jgi:hypothetical protein
MTFCHTVILENMFSKRLYREYLLSQHANKLELDSQVINSLET